METLRPTELIFIKLLGESVNKETVNFYATKFLSFTTNLGEMQGEIEAGEWVLFYLI